MTWKAFELMYRRYREKNPKDDLSWEGAVAKVMSRELLFHPLENGFALYKFLNGELFLTHLYADSPLDYDKYLAKTVEVAKAHGASRVRMRAFRKGWLRKAVPMGFKMDVYEMTKEVS